MNYSVYFLVFILSGFLTYVIQKIFIHYKKFDDFNHRSSHKTLATRTGGIGVFATLLVVSSYYYFNKIELFDYSLFIPLGIMFIVGAYDDFYHADFKLKLNTPYFSYTSSFTKKVGWGGIHPFFSSCTSNLPGLHIRVILLLVLVYRRSA